MGSKGSSTTSFSPPPEVVEAYKEALGYGRAAMGQQYQPYTGEITAPLTPTQESGITNVNRAVGTAIPYFSQATSMTANAANTPITPQQFSQEAIQQYQSPYTQAVADATFRNLREQQRQEQAGLQGQAIRAGAFGGDRAGIAAANMARQQDLATAQAMSQIYNQGYGQAVGLFGQQQGVNYGADVANAARQMQGAQQLAGLGTGLQGSVLQGAQAQLAAGAQQQAVQQAINSGYYNQYLGAQAYPYQQAQFFANLATGVGGQMGGTTTGTPAQPSPAGSIFGALGALGSIFSASDKRVKENIKPIGKTNDGQTIYRYNFKGDPTTQIGLIAQEVEKHHPDAVRTFNGVKGVDYKEATDDSVRSMGGGVVPSSVRKDFAVGGPSLADEEDPMIPYKAGVPSKVLQIPKLARIGGTKPNFGGELPKQPGTGGLDPSQMKGAAEGLGKFAKKYDLFGTKTDSASSTDDSTISGISDWLKGEARGGAIKGTRLRFADGDEVPETKNTVEVPVNEKTLGDADLPPVFRKGEISGQADEEGTPLGGVVPRSDIPLPPTGRPIDLSFPLIRKEEGFQARPIKDTDLKPRIGWSSDTQTTPEGGVVPTTWQSASTPEAAEHDLTRRVVEGQAWIKSKIGEDAWDQLSPEAKAAMTSIRYQYGKYPQQVLAAAATGDSNAVARAISTVGGPTPARRATEVALIGGKDIGLGNYQPGEAGYERLLSGKGAGSGGLGAAGRIQLAQADTGTATDANKNWPGFGIAGEGKRSIIESLMDKDFDLNQKRALFSFFAGMAASPSPWFGQQLGAGMQAASNVYNESMNKQAEIGIKEQELKAKQQQIGIQERLAGVQERTKALELLKFWQSQFIEIPTNQKGVYVYRDITNPDKVLTASEYATQMREFMKQSGVSPENMPAAQPKPGLSPVIKKEEGTEPAGGLVPSPKTAIPEQKDETTTTTPSVQIPKPTVVPPPKPSAAPPAPQKEGIAKEVSDEELAKKYPNVIPEDIPENIMKRAESLRIEAENARHSRDTSQQAKASDLENRAQKLEDKAKEIANAERKVRFSDGRPDNYIPGAVETKIERQTQEKTAAANLENNIKLKENLATEERKALPGKVTAMRIKDILENFRGGALADERNQAAAIFKEIGAFLGKPVTDEMIDSWIANPREYDKYVKETTKLAFNFINDADVGKRMTNLEMTTSGRAQTSPKTDPEASGDMIAEALAFNQYNEELRRGILKEISRVGPDKFNEAQFVADYNDKYGQKHFDNLYKTIRRDMGIRGATPTNRNALVPGQVYIIEPGTYNNRTGKPIKKRFMGNEKLPGNQIKTTFDPVE